MIPNEKIIAAKDIKMTVLYEETDNKYILGSAEHNRFIIVDRERGIRLLSLLQCLDGEKDINQLSLQWNMNIGDTTKIIQFFYEKGLLECSKPNEFTEINRMSRRICRYKISPQKLCKPRTAQITICIILVVSAFIGSYNLYCFFNNPALVYNIFKYNDSYLHALLFSMIVTIPSFLLHESCHALVSIAFGLIPECVDFCLYLFIFPLFYVRIPNIYFTCRRNRMIILAAGIIGNMLLGNVALLLFNLTGDGIFMPICLAQVNIIIANTSPFSLSDGYFFMSQLLKIENLRPQMFLLLSDPLYVWRNKEKINFKVFGYFIINTLTVIPVAIYISSYTLHIISDVINIELDQAWEGSLSFILILIYLGIIHLRFKGMNRNGIK